MPTLSDYQTRIRESFPEAVVDTATELGADVLTVAAAHVVDAARVLRDEFGFDLLLDITVVDWTPKEPRYDVHYQMLNVAENTRLRVKVQLPDADAPHVASVVDVWPAADWYEREVYDFFGVIFDGHPYLRRIFMPDEWIGHPLRKDYPVGGVPVEYKIEPAYVGSNLVPSRARPAAGGVPARLRRDRGRQSHWTWTGPPASDVRRVAGEAPASDEATPEEKAKDS